VTVVRRAFGTTSMEISRVGFGASAIGGGDWALGWGQQDDRDSVAAIRKALESGVNWIDTAALYGLGHSEEVVRRSLEGLAEPDRPYIFTKCGIGWDASDRFLEPYSDCSAVAIRRSVEASLRRLGVERVDLCQIHWPSSDGTPLDEYWGAMLELRAEGKIRAAGLSNHGITRVRSAEAIGHVDSLQPPFSAIKRTAAAELLPWCAAHGVATIGYSPMEGGLLSGAFSKERAADLADKDQRRLRPEYTDELEANLRIADVFAEIGRKRGVTTAAVAVAWTLAFPELTGAIVGARTAEQVDGWAPALWTELLAGEVDTVARVIEESGAGAGPSRHWQRPDGLHD
jgi:aryl-alcohol dehydrogenase-like predicted oxidoreductase